MMQQKAIVKTLKIAVPGQQEYFQLVLPKDISFLIGLEYGFNFISTGRRPGEDEMPTSFSIPVTNESFEVKYNYYLGFLSLMTPGCENIFFQEDMYMDKNFKLGEIVAPIAMPVDQTNYATKRHEYSFRVAKSSHMLEGIYRDAYRNDIGNFFPYKLRIYLWTEK